MRIESGSLSGLKAVGVIALVAAAAFLIPKLIEDRSEEATATPTFEATLEEVTEEFGEEAKVVSIADTGGVVVYKVITDGTTLTERSYSIATSDVRGPQGQPAQGRDEQVADSDRPATKEEIASAKVSLGELDPDVVGELWEQVGFPSRGSSAALTGTEWTISSGTEPGDGYVADVDGDNLRQTSSSEEAAGRSPEEQSKSLRSLGECIQAAEGDIAAIQACQARAN